MPFLKLKEFLPIPFTQLLVVAFHAIICEILKEFVGWKVVGRGCVYMVLRPISVLQIFLEVVSAVLFSAVFSLLVREV